MHEIVGDGELDALVAEIDGLRAELLSQAEAKAAHAASSPKVDSSTQLCLWIASGACAVSAASITFLQLALPMEFRWSLCSVRNLQNV